MLKKEGFMLAETILLVEDEDGLRTYLQSELQFEGYQVLTATTGTEAWAAYQAHQNQLALMILDWMIPELDGLEVMRRIRRHDDLPIMMMTARDYIGDKVAGLDNGADDYITKPFEIEELLARIRVIIRRKHHSASQNYQVGDLELNAKARQVQRAGKVAQLTQREFSLLQVLMQHAGEPLTRDELLDQVWGADYEGQTNIVDVYIRYLRAKIDLSGMAPLIHTVRGVGYILQEAKHGR
ncbi:winged helix family two component transcriptional regulator [Loigolactobacillus bifermentans DSM 20003]|uniref:Winged helix family two component transcriptional regulator n=1 Tax=Loigolactobacillus bifermentans DSM 20003 TaxID=1423726 RepID=A0A0R1GYR0_9LACO|nr:winged helix family two component transcriptional regulator [Loigolactobacillus bifermentans DSM 20003]